MIKVVQQMWIDDAGQDLIEYALIAALVALICVGAITVSGTSISSIWSAVANKIPTVS